MAKRTGRGSQQGFEDAGSLPERGARPKLGLHPLQLRRAAGREQLGGGRNCRSRPGRQLNAPAYPEPWCLDSNRAEQGPQPARAPLLESGRGTPHSVQARRAAACSATCLRNLSPHHARLQPGQQRLRRGEHQADLRERAGRRRSGDHCQLRPLAPSSRSVVSTSPASVLASRRTVHRITTAPTIGHQPGREDRHTQTACPRFLTLPANRAAS